MEQLTLTLAPVRRRDPATSRAAAARVDASGLAALVLDALRANPSGLTSHELAAQLGRDLVSISPRMRPLVDKGFVREAGTRDRRTIWRVA